jgi:hypothetical protein
MKKEVTIVWTKETRESRLAKTLMLMSVLRFSMDR